MEAIKPLNLLLQPPHHLKTYKLSLLDQIVPPVYIPVLLFYSATTENPWKRSLHLKESFSKTLVYFYIFVGRLTNSLVIDCNDYGAIYVEVQVAILTKKKKEVQVAIDMSIVLEEPEVGLLRQFLPCDDNSQSVLAIQVNDFACDGMAVCFCINHHR
ncbi:hypothetical protein DITRI_Ditri19aG0114900 [Diplodiscus trichospermus]